MATPPARRKRAAPGGRGGAAAGGAADRRGAPAASPLAGLARPARIRLAGWEHAAFLGKLRSGKTSLQRGLNQHNPSVIVVSTRGRGSELRRGDWVGFAPESDDPDIAAYEPRCVVYIDRSE